MCMYIQASAYMYSRLHTAVCVQLGTRREYDVIRLYMCM
jgi:hypothetical protein